MKAKIYSLDGKQGKEIDLPKVFEAEINRVLIKRAVVAIESSAVQPNGPMKRAGRNNSAEYRGMRHLPAMMRGINVGHARLPRMKNHRGTLQGHVAGVPRAVGGPMAHKLTPEKITIEKINKKEKRKATESAIACTAISELVKKRGHYFGDVAFPIVVDNEFEKLDKTKKVIDVFKALQVYQDVEHAIDAKKIRSGKGKRRGRKYKRKKSILVVYSENDAIFKASRNLEGVDAIKAKDLNAKALAPGTVPGRLTIYTEAAIKELAK